MKEANQEAFDKMDKNSQREINDACIEEENLKTKLNDSFSPRIVSKEVKNCYEIIMGNFAMRSRFFESFLIQIFNVEDHNKLESIIAKAVWNPANSDDHVVYRCLQTEFSESDGALNKASKTWKSLLQTKRQKQELLRETVSIVSKLGRLGTLKDYVSIGDTGKMVVPFLKASVVKGKVWVVHDTLGDIPGAVERGSENEVGKFVHIDYQNPVKIEIPSASADLITLNQGLHHQPQDKIMDFLSEVHRILRPNGLFIVREHDALPGLYPMLYLAHSVFNSVTGVTLHDEMNEIRAFRPILEWREIIEHAGFKDTFLYEMEKGDPTVDEMMCFIKNELDGQGLSDKEEVKEQGSSVPPNLISYASFEGVFPKEVANALDAIMSEGPNVLFEISRNAIMNSKNIIDWILANTKTITSNLSSGQQFLVLQMIENLISPLQNILDLLLPTLDGVKLKDANFELIPSELIVLAKALVKKGKEGNASPQEMIAISFILDAHKFISSFGGDHNPDENETTEDTTFDKQEVHNQIKNLLRTHPYLENVDEFSEMLGLNRRLKMMIKGQFEGGVVTSSKLTQLILDYVDAESWEEMSGPLEQIIQDPRVNTFSVQNLEDRNSPWWHLAMGFLGSPKVQFNSYVITFGSLAGFGKIIEMWQIAQKIRAQTSFQEDETIPGEYNLTETSEKMLKSAVEVLKLEENKDDALDSLIRCLKLAGITDKRGNHAEYTWFKLPEWLQVEIVKIFGSYMDYTPWYQFPFKDMLMVIYIF